MGANLPTTGTALKTAKLPSEKSTLLCSAGAICFQVPVCRRSLSTVTCHCLSPFWVQQLATIFQAQDLLKLPGFGAFVEGFYNAAPHLTAIPTSAFSRLLQRACIAGSSILSC